MSETMVVTATECSSDADETNVKSPTLFLSTLSKDRAKMDDFAKAASKFDQDYAETAALLRSEFSTIRADFASLRDAIARKDAIIEKRVENLEVEMEKEVEPALVGIYEMMSVMQSAILRYRPVSVGMTVRKQLDNARYSVAKGFCLLFEGGFRTIFSKFNRTEEAVEWSKFKEALQQHHESYLIGPVRATMQVTQRKSVFDMLNRDKLLAIGNTGVFENPEDANPIHPLPNTKLFKKDSFTVGDLAKLEIPHVKDEEAEDRADLAVYERLRFFAPAFIWAYNELKYAILVEAQRIATVQDFIADQEDVILRAGAEPLPLDPPPKLRDPGDVAKFGLGTAVDVRELPYWRDYFQKLGNIASRKGKKVPQGASGRGGGRAGAGWGRNVAGHSGITHSSIPVSVPFRRKRSGDEDGDEDGEDDRTPWKGPSQFEGPGASGAHSTAADPNAGTATLALYAQYDGAYPVEVVDHMKTTFKENLSRRENIQVANAIGQMYQQGRKRSEAIQRHDDYSRKFTVIYKCLSLLLDPNLLEVAVFGNSLVRLIVNYFAHLESEEDEVFNDSLTRERIQEISKMHLKAIGKQRVPPFDHVKETERLVKMLSNSRDYFYSNEPVLEKAIDKYVNIRSGDTLDRTEALEKDTTDIHVLLAWLNAFNPKPAGGH